MLNAFQVEDFLRMLGVGRGASSAVIVFVGEILQAPNDCVGVTSTSVASRAGDAALDELLLPSEGWFVGVLWGLADISVN